MAQSPNDQRAPLLQPAGGSHFLEDQGIKNGENVLAVSEDAADGQAIPGVTQREALPALFARLGPGERAILDGYLEKCAPYFADDPRSSPSAELALAGIRRRGA